MGEQRYIFAVLEIEHIYPQALGGKTVEENLWLACPLCNSYKGSQISAIDSITNRKISLFNPRRQMWKNHFKIINGIKIVGKTATGRATVEALLMNNGRLERIGSPKDISDYYLAMLHNDQHGASESSSKIDPDLSVSNDFGAGMAKITSVALFDEFGKSISYTHGGECVVLVVDSFAESRFDQAIVGFLVRDRLGQVVFGENTYF